MSDTLYEDDKVTILACNPRFKDVICEARKQERPTDYRYIEKKLKEYIAIMYPTLQFVEDKKDADSFPKTKCYFIRRRHVSGVSLIAYRIGVKR